MFSQPSLVTGDARCHRSFRQSKIKGMRQNRRSFLLTLLAGPAAVGARSPFAAAQTGSAPGAAHPISDFPDPKTFQSGDLVWPKKKGAFVPRKKGDQPPSKEQIAWEAERDRLLAQDPSKSGLSPEAAKKLKTMSYEE